MRKLIILSIFILTTLLIGCGGSEEPAASGSSAETINVSMHDIYYGDENANATNPPAWQVSSGARVRVSADNQGSLEHNWAIVNAGAELPDSINDPTELEDLILYDIGEVGGGETKSASFTAPEAGSYKVICTVAGHYPSMQGVLEVEG